MTGHNQSACGLIDECNEAWLVLGRRQGGSIDARSPQHALVHLTSRDWLDLSYNVAGVGDVNGDGNNDAALVAKTDGGRFVIAEAFLPRTRREMVLNARPLRGIWIYDDTNRDSSLPLFAGAGDVNRDGRADLLVVASDGNAYIVFGHRTGHRVTLRGIHPPLGFRLLAPLLGGSFSMEPAGDVNGDDRPDFLVCANGPVTSAFVVFGSRAGTTLDLGHLAGHGFEISPGAMRLDCSHQGVV